MFASPNELASGVDSKLLLVPVLHRLANDTYELILGHGKKLCESVDVVYLSVIAARLFSDEKPGDKIEPCV